MLSAAHRLRRSADFAAAIRGGRRAGRGTVVVHLQLPTRAAADQPPPSKPAPSGGTDPASVPPRAGFVVSKAVGNAVTRNTVRRRLRHLVRDRVDALPPGSSLVVRALPDAAGASSARLAADLDGALAAARTPRRPGRSRR